MSESRYNNLGKTIDVPKYRADFTTEEEDAYWKIHDEWRKLYNTCSICGSTKVSVRNFDEIWREGDVYCENNHHVRTWSSD